MTKPAPAAVRLMLILMAFRREVVASRLTRAPQSAASARTLGRWLTAIADGDAGELVDLTVDELDTDGHVARRDVATIMNALSTCMRRASSGCAKTPVAYVADADAITVASACRYWRLTADGRWLIADVDGDVAAVAVDPSSLLR